MQGLASTGQEQSIGLGTIPEKRGSNLCWTSAPAFVTVFRIPSSSLTDMVRLLLRLSGLPMWPVWLRKPLVFGLIRRKSLASLPFRSCCHGWRYEGDAANLIDYHILSRGAFEPGLTELLNRWAYHHGSGLFLDVGANVGVHSLGVCRHYAKVIAIEPYPPVADRLERSLSVNDIHHVIVKRMALSDVDGISRFMAPDPGNLGTGRLVGTGCEIGALEVPMVTGDRLLSEEILPLAAVKIDTEGAEKRVLVGLAGTLTRDRPLVVLELLAPDREAADAIRSLLPEGYRFFQLQEIRRRRFRLAPWSSGVGDIVAVPAEKLPIPTTRLPE